MLTVQTLIRRCILPVSALGLQYFAKFPFHGTINAFIELLTSDMLR